MRGKKAKRLRRQVYGEQSIRQERKYLQCNIRDVLDPKAGFVVVGKSRTIYNHPQGLRAKYQHVKRQS